MKSKDRSSRFPILLNVYESLYSVIFRLFFFFSSLVVKLLLISFFI